MEPRVINIKRKPLPVGKITYIGRNAHGTDVWGNPFTLDYYTRKQAILNYITVHCINTDFLLKVRKELKGRHLGCFCAPKPCHGDWLLHIANCEEEEFVLLLSGRFPSQAHWSRVYPDSEPE